MTQAELERDLEIDGLTLEACFLGLFGELIEHLPGYPGSPEREPAEEAELKVTQMGPGRRTEKDDDDDNASTT